MVFFLAWVLRAHHSRWLRYEGVGVLRDELRERLRYEGVGVLRARQELCPDATAFQVWCVYEDALKWAELRGCDGVSGLVCYEAGRCPGVSGLVCLRVLHRWPGN